MPKVVPELSPIAVKRLRHPRRGRNAMFAVGGVSGLMLQITPTGSRSWILRATVGAKRRDIGLGGYPTVTLAEARERAREVKNKIWRGIDPVEERKAERASLVAAQKRALTFGEAFEAYAAAKLGELGSDADRTRWRSSIERYALPIIGGAAVGGLTVQDVMRVLEPVWMEKTETASRVRARMEAILSFSTVAGHRAGDNPARWKGNLDALLPAPARVRAARNQPAVQVGQVAGWFAVLRAHGGIAARALEFLVLTAARSGEVRGAVWGEIDWSAGVWTIPAKRMKAEREHRVPLSAAATAVLDQMRTIGRQTEFIFPAPRDGALSDMSISACMRRMQAAAEAEAEAAGLDVNKAGWRDRRSGRPAVPHGIRSTFRDWVGDLTEYPRELGEAALAHRVGSDVELAYRRGDGMERRRAMMEEWARFVGAGRSPEDE